MKRIPRKDRYFMNHDIQRASLLKRVSAYIFDSIILLIVAVGVAFLLSTVLKYDETVASREVLRSSYESEYGVTFDIANEDFQKLTEEEQKRYNDAYAAYANDPEVNRTGVQIINKVIIITVFSVLTSSVIFELLIPLKLGDGRTLGKKIFGIGVMRVDGVRISAFQLFVRAILGKYTCETMIPAFLILLLLLNIMPLACILGIALILIVQLATTMFSYLHTSIHDLISGTVTVDFASQRIFESTEKMLEYKKKLHAEAADRAEYK